MRKSQKIISFLLALVMVIGMVPPMAVHAEEMESTIETVAVETVEEETVVETTVAAEKMTVPTEAVTEPVEEMTAPTEAVTEPIEETIPDETVMEEIVSFDAMDAATVASGSWGEKLTWAFDKTTDTLTISGSGPMDVEGIGDWPWEDYIESIRIVVVGEGITTYRGVCWNRILEQVKLPDTLQRIEDCAFEGCSSLKNITIPASVVWIGDEVFTECADNMVIKFKGNAPDTVENSFYAVKGTVYYPANNATWTGSAMKKFGGKINWLYTGDAAVAGGPCGDHVIWRLDADGVMTISGTGEMDDEAITYKGQPWGDYSESIRKVVIQPGVTTIAHHAFDAYFNPGYANIEELHLPDTLVSIGSCAFDSCIGLKCVIIPASVTSIDESFVVCSSLTELTFEGDAPKFIYEPFGGVIATAYYPANNPTWTTNVMQSGGGNITWVPYTPGEEPGEDPAEYHDTLASLKEIDYLAFSAIAYLPLGSRGTVRENLEDKGYWDDIWSEDQQITYGELCEHIAQWKIVTDYDLSDYNGFYAKPFKNDDDEIVIAYRGSVPPGEWNLDTNWDFFCDWLLNDLPLEIGNTMGIQLDDALEIYNNMVLGSDKSKIATTGHSLGGAWATAVSAYSGCKAVTFNSVSALDVLYKHDPEMMGKMFEGVDKWNFVDHTNQYDILAGMFEKYLSTEMKPYVAHKTIVHIGASTAEIIESLFDDAAEKMIEAVIDGAANVFEGGIKAFIVKSLAKTLSKAVLGDIAACHSLQSYVIKTEDGDVDLTEEDGTFSPTKRISNYMLTANHSVDFGSSGKDEVDEAWTVLVPRTSLGGNGSDTILTSWGKDHIIGGKGNEDELDGSWGDDTYIYYFGDGYDIISDISGNDVLKICGFKDIQNIDLKLNDNRKFVDICYNGEPIISVRSKNRSEGGNAFNIEYDNGVSRSISGYLNLVKYSSSINIKCPVNIEILDSNGSVVYTLTDDEVGQHYTDYGNFYIYEEKDGSYGKLIDLIVGYTARIVGHDDGTMKINYRDVVDGELAEAKNFVDVPVSAQFSATFEETEEGELVLAADTDGDNIVDAKIGYDGKLIPTDMVKIDQEYVALQIGETIQLSAKAQPAELTDVIQWRMEDNDKTVASVDENGLVTAKVAGTTYVIASVTDGKTEFTARCRVDVVEPEVEEQEEPVIRLNGVQLGTTKLTTELFSTDYAQFELLLELPQNDSAVFAMRRAVPAHNGVAIERVEFADAAAADAFELIPLDDRRIAVVPTEYALEYPKELKKSYKSAVTVWVDGEDYTTDEILTLTVKQSKPKLKAKIDTFNSFYTGQTQEITITGGTATGITVKSLPNWLTPNEDFTLSLNENAGTKNSGKAVLLVKTEEWNIDAEISLSVKNAYKAPGLKLNTTSVKIAESAANAGIDLQLQPRSKKDTLKSLDVADVLPPEGYKVEGFNSLTGGFTLKAANGFQSGKITLQVKIDGTTETVPLTLKVEIVKKNISVSFKASGNLDLSLPNHTVTVKPTFKNYNGSFTLAQTETQQFWLTQNGNTISVQCKDGTETGTYKLTLKLVLDDDITVENTVKITVKRTAVKLKLSSTKLSLNKSISDMASVTVTCTTKGYTLAEPIVKVMDKSGKNLSNGLDAAYSNGKLTVSVNEDTEPGATYKVQVRAYEGTPVAALTVTILKENKSTVTASLKLSGSLDVIRDGTAITLTPSYKNAGNLTEKVEKLVFYKTVKKETTSADGLFAYTRNTDGTYTITKAEGAALDHSAKYSVKLVSTIGSTEVEPKAISLTVKQGSAKLTLASGSSILFARDKYSRVNFSLTAKDVQLNDIKEVTSKDVRFVVYSYGNGEFALGFANNTVDERLKGKTVTVTLNIFLKGNETAKANTTAKLKVTILK